MSARLCLFLLIYGLFEGKDHVECVSMFPAPNIVLRSNRFSTSLWVNMLINLHWRDFMKIVVVWAVDIVLLVRPILGIFSYSPDLFCGFG